MRIHAIVCTRSREDISETTDALLTFLSRCSANILLVSGAKSLFSAYQKAYNAANPAPEDIIIFCHDDILIREKPEVFIDKLKTSLAEASTGFVGAAGTMCLGRNAVWWDLDQWKGRMHRGRVLHLHPETNSEYETYYGAPGDVAVLDGLFLAAKPKVIEDVGLQKPEYFSGEWDFYDLHYTSQAFLKGYTNKVIPLKILHNSRGELVGRDGWEANRAAFIANNTLPLQVHE